MPSGGSSSFKNFFDGLGKFANRSVTTIKGAHARFGVVRVGQ
ncbi:hypothetical protein [Thermoflexibacter ruber]|nr:hypothetical protein [Thermoflexibacter ruber]